MISRVYTRFFIWTGHLPASQHRVMRRIAVLLCLLPFAAPAQTPVEVDVELALMVDVSRSMSPGDLEIQRRGYAEALASEEVAGAIRSGLIGAVAVSYVEWAGANSQRVVVPWTVLTTQEDARAVAARLTSHFEPSLRRTSISGALRWAADSIDTNAFAGLRRVIDVSGDGPNNQGGLVTDARDAVVADGIVINGLPLMTRDGLGARWHLDDLDDYYRACVIGGPGAFVIPVTDWTEFALAVRRKLVLEIAGALPVQDPVTSYDCRIGEKIWERYYRDSLP